MNFYWSCIREIVGLQIHPHQKKKAYKINLKISALAIGSVNKCHIEHPFEFSPINACSLLSLNMYC